MTTAGSRHWGCVLAATPGDGKDAATLLLVAQDPTAPAAETAGVDIPVVTSRPAASLACRRP